VVKKIVAITSFCLLLSAAAAAQIPTKGNIFFGYSYNRADFNGFRSNFNGWDGSLEGKVLPWVGIVADVSGHYGSNDSIHSVVFGPRVSVSVGKITPFAHAMFGVSHFSSSPATDTSFADALGGGVDYRLFHVLGWRFQLDALQTRFFSRTQDDFRFSTGIVLHF
jgi:opacity protein-like surface antigen